MLIYEYKVDASKKQYVAIEEAIRIVQFIRNKCLRLWMDERGSPRTICSAIVLCLLKRIPLLLVSIPRHGKPQQIVPGLPFPASMTTARTTSQARKAIPGFSTITGVWSTKQTGWKLSLMASISSSPMAVALDACDWLAIPSSRLQHFLSSRSSGSGLSTVLMATMCSSRSGRACDRASAYRKAGWH